jgi:hypothetical protein
MSSLQWVKVDKEHHPIVRVSTNNFGSNKKIQAIPLASNRPHTEDQIKKDKNGKERGKSKKKELPTHKKLPTNRTPSEVIPKMPKAGFPNKDFPSKTNPMVLFRTTSKKVACHLREDDETNHLEDSYDNEVSRICKIDYGQPSDNNASSAST